MCKKEGCHRAVKAREMCTVHYELWRRKNPLEVVDRSGRWNNQDGSRMTCQYQECGNDVRTQGFCMKHYQQFYYATRKRSNV